MMSLRAAQYIANILSSQYYCAHYSYPKWLFGVQSFLVSIFSVLNMIMISTVIVIIKFINIIVITVFSNILQP